MVETLSYSLAVPAPAPVPISGSYGPIGRVLVVGTRLWAEHRTIGALEAAGYEIYTAEQLESAAGGGDDRVFPALELACVVRTDNSPAAGPRVTMALRRLAPQVGLVVVGNVAFHPFEERALGQIRMARLTRSALAALPMELCRFLPERLSRLQLRVS